MATTIDAKNKKIGRVASEAAIFLMGKNKPDYKKGGAPSPDNRVEIINAARMVITEKKRGDKEYRRYTGYPGGLKSENLENLISRRGGSEALRGAIYGMLPKNKLRSNRIKNLTIKE